MLGGTRTSLCAPSSGLSRACSCSKPQVSTGWRPHFSITHPPRLRAVPCAAESGAGCTMCAGVGRGESDDARNHQERLMERAPNSEEEKQSMLSRQPTTTSCRSHCLCSGSGQCSTTMAECQSPVTIRVWGATHNAGLPDGND